MRAVKCVTGNYRVISEDDRECSAATRPRDSQVSKTSESEKKLSYFYY